MRIDFAIAGFQKCGTTSLHLYLGKQPGIYMPKEKEMYYYSRDNNICRSTAYIKKYFNNADFENEMVGFSDVDLIMDPEALRLFKKDNPNAKLILIIRDPVLRSFSAFKFERQKVREQEDNFLAALDKDCKYKKFNYIERSLYTKYISKASEIFGAENIYITSLNALKENQSFVLSEIVKFLGLQQEPTLVNSMQNKTGKVRFSFIQKYLYTRNNYTHWIMSKLPDNVKCFLKKYILRPLSKLNTSSRHDGGISVSSYIKVKEKYFMSEINNLHNTTYADEHLKIALNNPRVSLRN